MTETDTKSRNSLYGSDLYAWTQEQARLLRERRWADLDLENLVDEVQSVGGSEKREIGSRLEVLLGHLLKWKYQPGLRGNSWTSTIFEQRGQILSILESSPSLRAFYRTQVAERYRAARLLAAKETGIAFGLFPEQCEFTADQVLDADYFPEDRSIE